MKTKDLLELEFTDNEIQIIFEKINSILIDGYKFGKSGGFKRYLKRSLGRNIRKEYDIDIGKSYTIIEEDIFLCIKDILKK